MSIDWKGFSLRAPLFVPHSSARRSNDIPYMELATMADADANQCHIINEVLFLRLTTQRTPPTNQIVVDEFRQHKSRFLCHFRRTPGTRNKNKSHRIGANGTMWRTVSQCAAARTDEHREQAMCMCSHTFFLFAFLSLDTFVLDYIMVYRGSPATASVHTIISFRRAQTIRDRLNTPLFAIFTVGNYYKFSPFFLLLSSCQCECKDNYGIVLALDEREQYEFVWEWANVQSVCLEIWFDLYGAARGTLKKGEEDDEKRYSEFNWIYFPAFRVN